MSSGSIEGFLSLEQTIAHLCESWKRTCANDFIDMSVMIGANTSLSFLTNNVGIGSSSHCLFGDSRMIRNTSSTETPTKPGNDGTSRCMIIGGGADAVAVIVIVLFD